MQFIKKIAVELIIFDLDGTLIDSSKDIAWAANKTLDLFGYGVRDIEEIKENIGWGVKSLLEKLMPGLKPERIMEARDKFLDFYGSHLLVRTCLYPGVKDMLAHFQEKGKKMAVVTNKPAGFAEKILKELEMSAYFITIVGGDSFLNRKPHPEPVEKVLDLSGVKPEKAVIVGDSPLDCEAGRRAGTATVGVTYGYRSKTELEEACCDMIIEKIEELKNVLM